MDDGQRTDWRFGNTIRCINWTMTYVFHSSTISERTALLGSTPCERRHQDNSSIRHLCIKATTQMESVGCATSRELYSSLSFVSYSHRIFFRETSICGRLTAILLELPISVVEGANLAGLQPTGNAVEVEGVLAAHCQLLRREEWIDNLRCRFPRLLCIPRW
jgi:hypothetical protein